LPALLAASLAAGLSSPVSAGVFEDIGGVVKDVGRAADGVASDVGDAVVDGVHAYGNFIGETFNLDEPFVGVLSPPPTPLPAPVPPGYARGKDGQLIPYGTPLPRIGKRPPAAVPLGITSPSIGKALGVNRGPLHIGEPAPAGAPLPPVAMPLPAPVPASPPSAPVAKPIPAPVSAGPQSTRVSKGSFKLEPGDSVVLEHKGPSNRGDCLSQRGTRDCKPWKRGEPWQPKHGPLAKRGDQWQPKHGPLAKRGEPWQPKHGPMAKRGDQWQPKHGPMAKRGDQWQPKHGPLAKRGDQWQPKHGPLAKRGAWAGFQEGRRPEQRKVMADMIRSMKGNGFGR